jgi:hypothetical protein
MSSRGVARTKSRDSVASIAYPAAKTASHVQGRHHHRAVKGTVIPPTITPEVVVAYAQCLRKAYLLLFHPEQGQPHEYVCMVDRQQRENQKCYMDLLRHHHADVHPDTVENLRNGADFLLNARLQAEGYEAECSVLRRREGQARGGNPYYEPTMCVGTSSRSPDQKRARSFVG